MSRVLKTLAIVLPPLGAVVGVGAGLPIWRSHASVPPDFVAAWLWVLGGFVAFAGGVIRLQHSRWIALACIFAGFLLLLSAGMYLPEARSVYDRWHSS